MLHVSLNIEYGGMALQTFFRYNWTVREQWYQWCEDIPYEELVRPRIGGVGGIAHAVSCG